MKTLALLAVLCVCARAQTPPSDKPAETMPAKPDTVVPPTPEVKEAAQKAAEEVAPKAEPPAEAKPAVSAPKLEETKPLPVEPKPEPKPEPKAEAPKAESARFAGAEAEWAFVKASAEDADAAAQEAAAEHLRLFARRFPDSSHAADALVLLAGSRAKKGDWQQAAVADLRVIGEYGDSSAELKAKSAYLELVDNKASRRLRPVLKEFVNGAEGGDRSDRLSALWRRVADGAPDAFYEAAADEIRDFFVRFPEHKDNDQLLAALARLHASNDKPASAVAGWRKLLALYPDSGLRAKALMSVGDLYADALRDPKKAIEAYQDLIAQYPKSGEILPALQSSARLFDDKLKQYDLSVQMDEKIVKGFPKSPASLAAFKAIARLQRDRLGKPDEAIKTLQRLSAMHKGQEGVDALRLSAEIARRDLKDYARQAALLQQIGADYPTAKETPEALYDAAGVLEDDVKDGSKALESYREIQSKFPDDKYGKKAGARADKLAAGK